jgi:hypothetical protein
MGRALVGLLFVVACSPAPAPNITIVSDRPPVQGLEDPKDGDVSDGGADADATSDVDATTVIDSGTDAETNQCGQTSVRSDMCTDSQQACNLPCGTAGFLYGCQDPNAGPTGSVHCAPLKNVLGDYAGTCCVERVCIRSIALDPSCDGDGTRGFQCADGFDNNGNCHSVPGLASPTAKCCP